MRVVARWRDLAGLGLEHCVLSEDDTGRVLEGVVVGNRLSPHGGRYCVRTDADGRTREVRVSYVGGPRLHVDTDGRGRWRDRRTDAPLPALEGCLDVDIGMTPATNMLPIRRLALAEGASAEILAAYVPLPAEVTGPFVPKPAPQRYTCLEQDRLYRYEGLFRGFSAELRVDAHGLVLDYPETFQRVDLPSASD